jgi:hypothetical protein
MFGPETQGREASRNISRNKISFLITEFEEE